MLKTLQSELLVLSNKARYIQCILDNIIDLRGHTLDAINLMLEENNLDRIDEDYKYLLKMTMDCLSLENVNKLNSEYQIKQDQYQHLNNKTIKRMWVDDLVQLKHAYKKTIN